LERSAGLGDKISQKEEEYLETIRGKTGKSFTVTSSTIVNIRMTSGQKVGTEKKQKEAGKTCAGISGLTDGLPAKKEKKRRTN